MCVPELQDPDDGVPINYMLMQEQASVSQHGKRLGMQVLRWLHKVLPVLCYPLS